MKYEKQSNNQDTESLEPSSTPTHYKYTRTAGGITNQGCNRLPFYLATPKRGRGFPCQFPRGKADIQTRIPLHRLYGA